MQLFSHFKQTDFEKIKTLMQEFPLATLAINDGEKLEACHTPLIWQDDGSEYGCLWGHVAKINPIYQQNLNNPDKKWLAIFQDTGHYISPNWYPNKAKTHKEVPTWNYRSVHFTVKPTLYTDNENLQNILALLTKKFEIIEANPWSLSDAPQDFLDKLCQAIVGFKLEIIDMQAQFKLSQNKSADTVESIIHHLQQISTPNAIAMSEQVKQANS